MTHREETSRKLVNSTEGDFKLYFSKSECHFCTFTSLMWRYSSMMAFAFFSTCSSVKAGLGREGGGVGALSRLTAEKPDQNKRLLILFPPQTQISQLQKCFETFAFLSGFIPGRSLLGPRSRLPLSRLPLSRLPRSLLPLSRLPRSRSSVMLATRRTGSFEARLSPPRLPRSFDSLLKLLLVNWSPPCSSLRANLSKRSLSRSLLSLSPPRSRLELDLKELGK